MNAKVIYHFAVRVSDYILLHSVSLARFVIGKFSLPQRKKIRRIGHFIELSSEYTAEYKLTYVPR